MGQTRIDFNLLLVWLFAAPAVLPLAQPVITHSADGLLHLYRVMSLTQALQQGQLFPRWLPDLAFGYGFPLFVFYAPLAYYISAFINMLPGVSIAVALNVSFGLALLTAASGMYLFAKTLLSPKTGPLAAVAYVYAPFQLYNALFRGSLPAAWAMALFPLAFWSFTRLLQRPGRRTLATSAFIFGLALLTHNSLSLLFVPLLAFYLLVATAVQVGRGPRRFRPAILAMTALVLGAGLAAFFLLPAIVEKEFAQVQRVIISPDFDFRFNFVSLAQLFSLPAPANTGLLNPAAPLTLGLVQVGLAVVGSAAGVVALRRRNGEPKNGVVTLVFGWGILAATIFLMLPVSQPVWERLPLIAFVQFPHRLLGPAALVTALLAGLAVTALPPRAGLWFSAAGIVLLFLAGVPLLYPRYQTNQPARPTPLDMFAYEHQTGAIGTTSFGEYLPIWVVQTPPDSPLEAQYRRGGPIDRLARDYLPAEAVIHASRSRFNQTDLDIWLPQRHQLIFNIFYFPGWQASVDGQPTGVHPFSERGLIAVDMPQGRHTLRLAFVETPRRHFADIVSLVALAVILGLAVTGAPPSLPGPASTGNFSGKQQAGLMGLALALILLKLLYLDAFSSPLKFQFDGTTVAGADVVRRANFGDQINLLGYSLNSKTMPAGGRFRLMAYWQARQPLFTDFSALAQLADGDGHLYAGQDNLHPGGLPTSQWQPWGFVQDEHTVPVPPGTPPGDYFLVAGLYHPRTWARLPVLSGGDPGWADVVAVPVSIEKPARRPTLAELGIDWPVSATFGPLQLLGATPERDVIIPNDFLRMAVFWEALTIPAQDYQISLRLVDAAGTVVLQDTQQPSYNRYPTSRWVAGERVRDNHALWVPADFLPGDYTVQVTVLAPGGQSAGPWVKLGLLRFP